MILCLSTYLTHDFLLNYQCPPISPRQLPELDFADHSLESKLQLPPAAVVRMFVVLGWQRVP